MASQRIKSETHEILNVLRKMELGEFNHRIDQTFESEPLNEIRIQLNKLQKSLSLKVKKMVPDPTLDCEHRNSLLQETMSDGYVIQNAKGEIIEFNSAALDILGLTADQLLGKTSTDKDWKSVREDGEPFPGEEHPSMVSLKSGEKVLGTIMGVHVPSKNIRWIRINATPFETHERVDQPIMNIPPNRRTMVTFADITEIIQREQKIRFVLDTLAIGIWHFNPVTQELHWDRSMFPIFDIKESEFTSHYNAWESTLTPEAKAEAVKELGMALSGDKEFNTVFEIDTKTRGKRHIAGRGKVLRDENGKAIMMYGANFDVTDRRANELENQRVVSFLQAVLDYVPTMIFVKDFDKKLSFSLFNRAGETLLGTSKENLIGKNDYDFFPKEQADFFHNKDLEVFKSGKMLKIDQEEIQTPNGQKFLRTYKVPTFDEKGNPQLLIGISTDITEEVMATNALEIERSKSLRNAKLASLGEMSAGVAHEINNPLAIIDGTIRALPKFAGKPEQLKIRIDTITKAVERIAKIVRSLRKFSRTSVKSEYKNASFISIIQEALTLTDAKAKRHAVSISVDLHSTSNIYCDEIELEQVVVNLINNSVDAIKHQDERWIQIELFDEGDSVVFRIRDAGKGIPADVRKNLFQPFFTTKPVGEGTGLGLSIVKGIIDEHRATIDVLDQDKNTCFEIRFQIAKEHPHAV